MVGKSKAWPGKHPLAFVTIIDPHTSTATCFRSLEREASLVEGGKWDDNPVHAELYNCYQ